MIIRKIKLIKLDSIEYKNKRISNIIEIFDEEIGKDYYKLSNGVIKKYKKIKDIIDDF